jgi:hypothetical protein
LSSRNASPRAACRASTHRLAPLVEPQRIFGHDKISEVRELDNDMSFLRNYLTEELGEELDLFGFGFQYQEDWTITEKRWERVCDQLVGNLTNYRKASATRRNEIALACVNASRSNLIRLNSQTPYFFFFTASFLAAGLAVAFVAEVAINPAPGQHPGAAQVPSWHSSPPPGQGPSSLKDLT